MFFAVSSATRFLSALGAALLTLGLAACGGGSGGGDGDPAASVPPPAPATFSIGGVVSGLEPGKSVVLQNNGGDDVTVASDGSFAFATPVAGAYSVTVARQPLWQDCAIAGGAGTAGTDVASVKVTCADAALAVTTVAGRGGMPGNADGNGTAASFSSPAGVALDASGNLYVADWNASRLRKIAPNGDVSTVAIGLNSPVGVALGPDGNLYVATRIGHRILRVTPGGAVSTFAGSGTSGGTDGNGTSASFQSPYGVAFDTAGNLYVSELGGNRIRKITPAGDVSTIAGTGVAGGDDGPGASATFNLPYSLAVDSDGVIYVADGDNHKIRRIATDRTVTTFAGTGVSGSADGAAAVATFARPLGIALGPDGALYVTDYDANKLRRISSAGIVSTIAGIGLAGTADGPATTTATLNAPFGIALDAGETLYFTDSTGRKVRKLGR